MHYFQSPAPIVRNSVESFFQHVEVAGEKRAIEFSKEVVWLRESETCVLFKHGGQTLHEGACYSDGYGYLTSMQAALSEAKASMAQYKIGVTSTLELVLVTQIHDNPALVTPQSLEMDAQQKGTRRNFGAISPSWSKKVIDEGETLWHEIEAVLQAEAVVWSSKNTDAVNQSVFEAFKNSWAIQK